LVRESFVFELSENVLEELVDEVGLVLLDDLGGIVKVLEVSCELIDMIYPCIPLGCGLSPEDILIFVCFARAGYLVFCTYTKSIWLIFDLHSGVNN
jgi:hypothetical protein